MQIKASRREETNLAIANEEDIRRGSYAMELREAVYGRRAVRAYDSDPVDDGLLRQLIDAAIQAPSAVNQQPWSFTVLRNQALLDRISRESKGYMLGTLSAGPTGDHFRKLLSDPNFQIFYHAPVLVLISAVSESPWAVEDCSLAAENLMLSAYAAGLGTCWIGFAQKWLATPQGKDAIGIPPAHLPVAPIIVGRPKTAPAPVPRKEPDIRWLG